MKSFVIISFLLIINAFWACEKANTNQQIELPDTVYYIPRTTAEALIQLDSLLTDEIRSAIRKASESELKSGVTGGGISIWMNNTWHLYNDTSALGAFFAESGIASMQRGTVLLLAYHRHINQNESAITQLLDEFREQTEQSEAKNSIDSLFQLVVRLEMDSIIKHGKLSSELDGRIKRRNQILAQIGAISDGKGTDKAVVQQLNVLTNHRYNSSLTSLLTLEADKQQILLEQIKYDILLMEHDWITEKNK